ncbi:MAG: hypothetical protein ACXVCY_13980 [Pseudobdellovibrionaceae bacterium]
MLERPCLELREPGVTPGLCRNGKQDLLVSPIARRTLTIYPEQEQKMKKIGFFLVVFTSIYTLADTSTVADKINAENSCACNGLPGNIPVVGLFHKSKWGTSALKVFNIDDPKAEYKCLELLNQLKAFEVCK